MPTILKKYNLIIIVALLIFAETGFSQKSYTILGLGDSITEGNSPNKSYLFPLWEKLYKAGYLTEFIGPNTHQCEIGSIRNAGFGGKNAEYLDVHIDSIYTKHPADIVLLHTGHNHFIEEKPIEGIIAAQKSIISKIVAINPNVKIFIAQVITSGKLPKYSYIPELNKQISHLADQLQKEGLPIILVDQSKDFNWKIHCLKDKVHPNSKGAELMANTWFKSVDKELEKSMNPIAYKPEITTYKTFDDSALKLHIFKPLVKKNKGKRPAIVFFFGGGWSVGSPLQFYKECEYYASKGFVAISAGYRTAYLHKSTAFESVSDAKSAIRWIRENANKYNIDTCKIVAAGASAGGHIAAAAGTIKNLDEVTENKSISSVPNLLLLYYPVVDNSPNGYGSEYIKNRFTEISPMHNINSMTPPTLIILGTDDPVLSIKQAELYKSKMTNVGGSCKLIFYKNAGHPIFHYRKGLSDFYDRIRKDSDDFLIEHDYLKVDFN
jgi:acetyl esterase